MKLEGFALHAAYDPFSLSWRLFIVGKPEGERSVHFVRFQEPARPEIEGAAVSEDAYLQIAEDEFRAFGQRMMDEFWKAGIRPTDAGSVNGELSATREHLASVKGILESVLPSALKGLAK